MAYEFKVPFVIKILFGLLAVGLLFGIFIYLFYFEKKNKSEFYKSEFSTIVIDSKLYQERTFEFLFQNGLKVYFLPPVDNKIIVGDSVKKNANTYQYNVYRKDNNTYALYATYNFQKIQ